MSVIHAQIPRGVRSAIARQVAAAEARDPLALRAACVSLVRSMFDPVSAVSAVSIVRDAWMDDRLLGSLLVAGRGPTVAVRLRAGASRWTPEGEIPMRSIPEIDLRADELLLLREIRLLEGAWRPFAGFADRRDLRTLSPTERKRVHHLDGLGRAAESREPAAVSRAIAAIARDDRAIFSILAYALYREAQRHGLIERIPRKYAF